jgi:hypothetical protein
MKIHGNSKASGSRTLDIAAHSRIDPTGKVISAIEISAPYNAKHEAGLESHGQLL